MGAGVAAGGVAFTGLGAGPAAANDRHDGPIGLSGSWLVSHADDPPGDTSPVKAVFSFAGGGVFVEHDINPAGPPFTGTWAQPHGNRFKATIWSGFPGEGGHGPTARVQLRGSRHHGTLSGTYVFDVIDPVSNDVVESGTGSFTGVPIDA
jgi:hypothetical protein